MMVKDIIRKVLNLRYHQSSNRKIVIVSGVVKNYLASHGVFNNVLQGVNESRFLTLQFLF